MKNLMALVLTLCVLAPVSAHSDEIETMNIELCRQVLARMLCKAPAELHMVNKVKEGLFLFSTFYAKKETQFYCGVGGKYIQIQGKEFRKVTHTIPYTFDVRSKCSIVEYLNPECSRGGRIVVCAEKTLDEKAAEDFWNRPIPDLLEEDLKRALGDLDETPDAESEKTPSE